MRRVNFNSITTRGLDNSPTLVQTFRNFPDNDVRFTLWRGRKWADRVEELELVTFDCFRAVPEELIGPDIRPP